MTNALHYQVWQGTVSQLQTESTHVHYLKNIKRQQQMAGATAIAQAALHEAGAVFSAQAAIDEGDPVQGFTMQVAGKTVQGSFWKTTFKDGDEVQVIGEERNGIFTAVAVTKPSERTIWMQPHCERGTKASGSSILKKAAFATCTLFLIAPLIAWLSNTPYGFMYMMAGCTVILIWGVMVI